MFIKLLIVKRESYEENMFAVVRWSGSCLEADLKKRITQAVNDWIQTSDEGQLANENSNDNFNIGDLSACTGDKELASILALYGIVDLEIDVFSDERPGDWAFDDLLNQKAN